MADPSGLLPAVLLAALAGAALALFAARALRALPAAPSAPPEAFASLLEAARAAQLATAQVQAGLAAHRAEVARDVAGLRGAVAQATGSLAEVRRASEAHRAAQAEARALLERVHAEAALRAEQEARAFARLERLEAVLAGSRSRGAAGENVLASVLRQLPPELRAHDVRIGGGVVEFAIPLPGGRFLPVDSKWTSVDKLDQLARAQSPAERTALAAAVQRDVEAKVDEVARYLDPERTCMVAVLALPDAVYELCDGAHAEAHRRGVLLVAWSMAVPYVLAVVQVARRLGARVDEAQLGHAVGAALGALDGMSDELEGRFARAVTSLDNSRRALQANAGKARQALLRVQPAEAEQPLVVEAAAIETI
jgi:DNA recombination protein RmuC